MKGGFFMCGRFSLVQDPATGAPHLFTRDQRTEPFRPRYNIAPTQPVPAVVGAAGGERSLGHLRWGLIPGWAKDPAIGNRLINARSETVAEKPSFRTSFHRRRCVILADGFYEWQAVPGQKVKQPYRITMKDDTIFAMAGLWDRWTSPAGEEIYSCTIITTQANTLLEPIHHRMPVILDGDPLDRWLDPALEEPEELLSLLNPFPDDAMAAWPVSTKVNNPRNDTPDVIAPLEGGLPIGT